jgi:non-homologous end joining protein Ku
MLVIENTAVAIPVSAHTMIDKNSLGLNKRSICCNAEVHYSDTCGKCRQSLTKDLVGKGYKLGDKMIPLDEEQLKAIKPSNMDAIVVKGTLSKLPSVLDTDKKYFLAADEQDVQAREAYQLLLGGLQATGRVLIGSTIVRQKEHVLAVEALDSFLLCSFLHYASQQKPVPKLDYGTAKPHGFSHTVEDVQQIAEFINGLPAADLSGFKDSYGENLLRLIQGEKVESIPRVEVRKVSNAKAMFVSSE